ncbi:MAG: response regulator transcription factor [Clostridiaceae bacterium]|jgi:DNA-binding NarL/FixJ family response regulator|nr:response regulator transcription factor [Clostridiaceae bacterium]
MIRIILADDQRLMTDGLKTILETRADIQVAGLAANGRQVLDILENRADPADLVLLDVRMPEMDGVQTVRAIKEKWPQLRVLMLTTFNDETYLLDALAGGADGYLLKDMETADLFAAIDQAMAGHLVLPGQVADKLRSSIARLKERQQNLDKLRQAGFSPREMEIGALLAEGYTNSQIAAALYLTDGTVRNYVSAIYDKLAVTDRTQAALHLKRYFTT